MSKKWGETRYEFIAAALEGPVGRVLSMGCSYGWELGSFCDRAEVVIGIDLDEMALASARLHYPQCHFDCGSVASLPYGDASFDVVVLSEVIEHVGNGNKEKVIKEAHRVLKPAGRLVFSAPHKGIFAFADPGDFKRRFPQVYKIYMRLAHYTPFNSIEVGHQHLSMQEIGRLFEQKFRIMDVRFCGFLEPWVGWLSLITRYLLRKPWSALESFQAYESGMSVPRVVAYNVRLVATRLN